MWCPVVAVLASSLLILGQGSQSAQGPPSAEEINRAVEQLGDDRFTVRERASQFLWEAGRAAEPALREAAGSDDVEVVARARRILRSFQYGVYPDTPEEIVRLISQFRHGSQAVKQAVLKKLMEMEEMRTLSALLNTERDERSRTQLVRGLVKDLDKVLGGLFISGDWAKAEQLLELGAVNGSGMRNYAAYLLLRDQLDAEVAKLKDDVSATTGSGDATLLVHLLRAQGDLHGARAAAEKNGDPSLIGHILFELGAWKELAENYDKAGRDVNGNLSGGIVHLGYTAAYHRLAGNTQRCREAVAGIQRLADVKPNKIRYCAEALLVNDRFQDAVDMYRRQGGTAEFEILCRQRRFREALKLVGVGDPRGPYLPWFAPSGPEAEVPSGKTRARYDVGVAVASMLYRLGEKREAVQLFAELAQAAISNKSLSVGPVCEAESKLGLREEAFAHAAKALDTQWTLTILRTLFPERSSAAEIWWGFLCRQRPEEPRQITLGRLRDVLQPASSHGPASSDWLKLVEEAEEASLGLSQKERGQWLAALGETCLARGRPQLGQGYFEKAAEVAPSVASLTKVADLLARQAAWQKAAEWYRRAWEADRAKPLALFLQGRALLQAGQESEGRKLIAAARLLPLGNADTRCSLAKGLQDCGLAEEAARQWEVMLRTGEFQSWAVSEAARQLGNLASGKDDLQAAAYWQRPLLRCLQTSSAIMGVEGYLEVAHLVHKARARGLLAAGRVEEAIPEIRLSHTALPGEIDLVLDVVPELEKAGRRPEADELFDEVFAVHGRVCEDFPKAAGYHNKLAWLAARCTRRLDEGLEHAGRAVGLAPEEPAYLDTLAEVHFQRGERQKAIELAKRCIELDPQQEHFRRQLDRFQVP